MNITDLASVITNEGERYLPDPRTYNAAMHLGHMASYREALRYSYNRRVLDLGCGVGYGAFWLASYGAGQVTAVDLSHVALRYAQSAYPHPRLRYVRADALNLPFADASFDFIFSSQVIEHLSSAEQFMYEIRRLLVPDGFCLITTPNKAIFSPYGTTNPHHPSEMTWSEYQAVARRVFPHTWFRGIPQRCLTLSEPHKVLFSKSNAEIRLEDYRVQDDRLEECENMLCFGHNRAAGEFSVTLPAYLQAAADELAPIFWDASLSRWMLLGVYPGDQVAEPITLNDHQRLVQTFRSPYPGLYRVEVDLAMQTSHPIRVALHQDRQTVAEEVITPDADKITLLIEPYLDSQDQTFTLTLELARTRHWWSLRRESVLLRAANGLSLQAECRVNSRLVHRNVAMRTYHATLPPCDMR
ncbi:MAG TPA: class I SAM-dependent methyltransferase [Anaerolineae bacterium]|nr:class I SAM-dependent methyltransferase [Anaerolineae bacterium]HQK15380.1 class I SAM-dependent methyltransferase [Anaerolineae bacterium]